MTSIYLFQVIYNINESGYFIDYELKGKRAWLVIGQSWGFLKQYTLYPLLSTGWFQELISQLS